MKKGMFSISAKDSEYFKDNQNKIELVNCKSGGKNCKEHLSVINKSFLDSGNYQRSKDYQRSIESLKNAYDLTFELQEASCIRCAELFRSTIIQSMENMHDELHKMSTGLFKTKRFKNSYILAASILKDLKSEQ